MAHKPETFSLSWPNLKHRSAGYRRMLALALGMLVLALTAVIALRVVSVQERTGSIGAALDIEAASARYQALAVTDGAESTGRERGAAADTARWQAQANRYPARYERSHAAASARYQALAAYYGARSTGRERGAAADAARWQAQAAQYPARYERSNAATSARYQALGEWYLRAADREE